MEFSLPSNARHVNTQRVLSLIREEKGLTRARISERLILNKVSVGEIVDSLVKEGKVTEGVRVIGENRGRPGTTLSINPSYASVIGMDIQRKTVTITGYGVSGMALRSDRIPFDMLPDGNALNAAIENTIKKCGLECIGLVAVSESEIKDGVFTDINLAPLKGKRIQDVVKLGFPSSLATALEAEAEAERAYYKETLEDMLFINWGEKLSSALLLRGGILPNFSFGSLPFTPGTLSDYSSGEKIRENAKKVRGREMSMREIVNDAELSQLLLDRASSALGEAISYTLLATGAKAVIIGGSLSSLPVEHFETLNSALLSASPKNAEPPALYISEHKEKGSVVGAGLIALDRYFFEKSQLLRLGY